MLIVCSKSSLLTFSKKDTLNNLVNTEIIKTTLNNLMDTVYDHSGNIFKEIANGSRTTKPILQPMLQVIVPHDSNTNQTFQM